MLVDFIGERASFPYSVLKPPYSANYSTIFIIFAVYYLNFIYENH